MASSSGVEHLAGRADGGQVVADRVEPGRLGCDGVAPQRQSQTLDAY
jgi:hypothetical protein